MKLKPLPRLLIIATIFGGALFGYTEWKKTLPKVEEHAATVPMTPPVVEAPVQQAQEPQEVKQAEPQQTNVSSGSAGMAALLKNANKK